MQTVPFQSPRAYIESVVLGDDTSWIESVLVREAANIGLRPSLLEHLSFSLPLVCGGSATVDNLEVMDGEAHLEIVGQIIEQSRDLPEGTPIDGFNG